MSEVLSRACKKCGGSAPEESQFCPGCGADLGPAEEAPEGDTIAGHVASDESKAARSPKRTTAPAPEPDRSGLVLDWSPELVKVVQEAAALQGVSVDHFVLHLVEPAAKKVVQANQGLLTLDKAADLLGMTRKEVIQMITAGKLRARKVDEEWKVDQQSLLEASKNEVVAYDDVELELHQLAKTAGLMGVETEGDISQAASATLIYVNQDGILICPRSAWKQLGPKQAISEAKDAVRRFMKRRDQELGRL